MLCFAKWTRGIGAAALFLVCAAAQAELRLPHALGDHMVLQRDAPIHIWGWAGPGEAIHVALQPASATKKAEDVGTATADKLGQWSVYLQPRPAGGPYSTLR